MYPTPKRIMWMFNELSRNGKTTVKVEKLKQYLEDEDFRRVVTMALDPRISYNLKTIEKIDSSPLFEPNTKPNWDEALTYLSFLGTRNGATDEEKLHIASLVADKLFSK